MAQKVTARGWKINSCDYRGAAATGEWRATRQVSGILELDRTVTNEDPMKMELTLLILDDLPVPVLIGAEDVRRFQLANVLTALLEYDAPMVEPIELPTSDDEPYDGSFPEAFPMEFSNDKPFIEGNDEFPIKIQVLIDSFKDVFDDKVGSTPAKVPSLVIEIKPAAINMHTKCRSPRPQPQAHLAELRRQLKELEKLGVVKKCPSSFFSQVVLAVKKDGTLRFCIDYRRLNFITIPEHWPLPDIKSVLRTLAGFRFFAVLDLTAGYHQCPLDEKSQYLSAFITPDGIYVFTRVPFGLKNAPAYFQRMISMVLQGLIGSICHAYIDDIIVMANSQDELLKNIATVLQRLREHGLKVKLSKCQFGLTKVEYLGFVVDGRSIEIDPKKLEALKTMAIPSTISELRGFIGFINFFRDHVPGLANALAPLTRLTGNSKQKKVPVPWTPALNAAYETVKDMALAAHKLMHLRDEGELILYTDASDFGVGAALLQRVGEKLYPIIFVSKILSAAQINWTTTDKEMFAVVFAVRKLHSFLANRTFIVRTDHRNLSFDTRPSSSAKVERWKLSLQEYDFVIEHIPGTDNVLADTLSRLLLITGNTNETVESTRVQARPDNVEEVIKAFHGPGFGHPGTRKTFHALRTAGFNWPKMSLDVATFIRHCLTCQQTKANRKKQNAQHFHVAVETIDDTLQIDHMGPLRPDSYGNQYVLLMVDCFSRYIELTVTKSTDANEVVDAVISYCCRYGTPKHLHSDRGKAFTSDICKDVNKRIGSEITYSASDSHEENAIVERFVGTVRQGLESLLLDPGTQTSNWPSLLPLVMRMCNGTVHASTGETPATLRFGRNVLTQHLVNPELAREPGNQHERLNRLLDDQEKATEFAKIRQIQELGRRIQTSTEEVTTFAPGVWVWRRNPQKGKTDLSEARYIGPFEVLEQIGNQVRVRNARGNLESVLHVQHLKLYTGVQNPRTVALEGTDLFPVAEIVGHVNRPNKQVELKYTKLQVRWDDGQNTVTEEPLSDTGLRRTVAFIKYALTIPDLKRFIPKRVKIPENL